MVWVQRGGSNIVEDVSYAVAFLAGLFTITTPCIIPILPPMLAGSVGHKLRPVLIVCGMAVSFTLMGGLFSAFGLAARISGGIYRPLLAFVIMAFGAVMADEEVNELYVKYSSRFSNSFMSALGRTAGSPGGESLKGAFLLGLTLGIVWVPCVGPILGAVLAYASVQGSIISGSLMLLVYSAGLGLPMLMVAYGGKFISSRMGIFKNTEQLRKIAGWVLIMSGIFILLGIDRFIQNGLLPYIPDIESRVLGK